MKNTKLFALLTILSIFFVGYFLVVKNDNLIAKAEDNVFSIDDNRLYNETNTYPYNYEIGKDYGDDFDGHRYDLSNKDNTKIVSQKAPMITVFTHGLGSDASDWSNDGISNDFAYSDSSLITKIARIIESDVYWVRMDDYLKISNLTNEVYEGIISNNTYYSERNNDYIENTKKHIIIIFESSHANGTNDEVYNDFNYAISRIVYDIKTKNGEILPTMNLIGHSRGGITNLQYALDHPDLVKNIFSMGTPYMGSTTASIDYDFLNSEFAGAECRDGESDIVSYNTYSKYLSRWNGNYDKLYSKINVLALGGYTSIDSLITLVENPDIFEYIDEDATEEKMKQYSLIAKSFLAALETRLILENEGIFTSILNFMRRLILNFMEGINFTMDGGFDGLVHILANEFQARGYNKVYLKNDLLVDLDSQLGISRESEIFVSKYKGFKTKTKMFTPDDVKNGKRARPSDPAVTHNLETMDRDFGTFILAELFGEGSLYREINNTINFDFEYSVNESGEAIIKSYLGRRIQKLNVPSLIDGYIVTGIGDNAYSYLDGVEELIIPESIKIIGKNAISNNPDLKTITFKSNSSLIEIGSYSFNNNPSLTSFNIGANVSYIGDDVFDGTNISYFSINNNPRYEYTNGLLIHKNLSINVGEAIYSSKQFENVVVPIYVKELSPRLFMGDKTIKTINLNNVEYIGYECFYNSSIETIIGGGHIKSIGEDILTLTPWINERQNDDFIYLSDILLKCNVDEEEVIVSDNTTIIGSYAFSGETVKRIILPSTVIEIMPFAFDNVVNLELITFESTIVPDFFDNTIRENIKLYVPLISYDTYKNNLFYISVINQIYKKNVEIFFKDVLGNVVGSRINDYYGELSNYIEPETLTGKTFLYWTSEDNNIYYKRSLLSSYKDLVLTPIYENDKYTINLINGNNASSITLEYGSIFPVPIINRNGYEFLGWYDSESAGNQIVDSNNQVVWNRIGEVTSLYARYRVIEYSINYITDIGTLDETNSNTFSVENKLSKGLSIKDPKAYGYFFECWTLNGEEFKSTEGIFSDITIKARWKGTLITPNVGINNIEEEYAIISLIPGVMGNTNNEYIFNIENTVKAVTFISNGTFFTNMKIYAYKRGYKNLILGFKNIGFSPKDVSSGSGNHAITAINPNEGFIKPYTLYFIYTGIVTIKGGRGGNGTSYIGNMIPKATNGLNGINGMNGLSGGTGGYGIYAYQVEFNTDDSMSRLKITGGNGGDGGWGQFGQEGADGQNGPSGKILKPVNGDNGGNGGDGGNGGSGGRGGYAVYTYLNNGIKIDNKCYYIFTGGAGGNGATAGGGGDGGKGADDNNPSIWTGYGNPGNGGNGGKGGSGGNGGAGSKATNCDYVKGIGGLGGEGGQGYFGGKSGKGGQSQDGKTGSNGSKGSVGSDGVSGKKGENASGQTEKPALIRKTIEYYYNLDFVERLVG